METNSSSRWVLWQLALIAFEAVNVLTVAWLVTTGGLYLGLAFGLIGVYGIFITPASPGWKNPVWSILALVVNGALIGTAAKTAAVLFVLGDPLIFLVAATLVFVALHWFLVDKMRKALAGYYSSR